LPLGRATCWHRPLRTRGHASHGAPGTSGTCGQHQVACLHVPRATCLGLGTARIGLSVENPVLQLHVHGQSSPCRATRNYCKRDGATTVHCCAHTQSRVVDCATDEDIVDGQGLCQTPSCFVRNYAALSRNRRVWTVSFKSTLVSLGLIGSLHD